MTSESPRVPLPELDDATPEVRQLFDAFMRERGNVPNLFRAASLRPPIVLTLFAHLRAVTGPGEVPVLLKELLTVRVSQVNACSYCLASHTALSRKHGATDEQIASVDAGRYDVFEPGWRAALAFADAMTPTNGDVTDEIYAELARWWTAPQIVEIAAVIGFFNYFNRFAEALRIPVTR
ncbi:MAG: carboxymuconolactone decarboxylase family protein [Gemmatimonadota bacterium]|nr:carboxymuconolactone decarboxylase family protein [Gemmatimonadota bacterium]